MYSVRIDDIGASAKKFNSHIKFRFQLGKNSIRIPRILNIGPLKTCNILKGWAPYNELKEDEWIKALSLFEKFNIIPIIAITATWVEQDSRLIPFPIKFPRQADLLKNFLKNKKVIIANHGLTHCIPGRHTPLFWGSNQFYWREFYPFLEKETHHHNITRSQKILETFFEEPIRIFVPPGNIWSKHTYLALRETNIKKIIANRYMADCEDQMPDIDFINDKKGLLNIHDREIKLYGSKWLEKQIKAISLETLNIYHHSIEISDFRQTK
jgi:predicted deacetylase